MKVLVGVRGKHKIDEEFVRTFDNGVHSFEIWVSDEIHVVFCSTYTEQELVKRIMSFYPDAELYNPAPPDFYVEFAARIKLKDPFLPIRTDTAVDPLQLAIASLAGGNAILQIVFLPAPEKLSKSILEASKSLTKGRVVGWFNPKIVPPSNVELSIANEMLEKSKNPLYYVEIRLISDFEVDLGWLKVLSNWKQRFEVKKVRNKKKFLKWMLEREIRDKSSILSAKELSLLVHMPKTTLIKN